MLRDLRASDLDALTELNRRHFPDEARLLLMDSAGFRAVLGRAFRWDARIVLGMLRLFRRPLLDLLGVEVDGRLAGATFVFYSGPFASVASVVVDTPYRGRGLAQQLMAEAEARALRRGCRYLVLEVLEQNAPAIALYDRIGFSPMRRSAWYYREVGPEAPPLPEARAPGGAIRPFRRGDGIALLPLAIAAQSEEERRIRPARAGTFRVAPPVVAVLGGATDAWVRTEAGACVGFVRSSTSRAVASGHLNAPLIAPTVEEPGAMELLDAGLAWFREHPVPRIVCEAPDDDPVLRGRLAARGFERGLGIRTLAKAIAG